MDDQRRRELRDLTQRFTDAFNGDDLEAVMAFFTADAVYDEFNGRRSEGKVAIRAAFVPQFRGDFGKIRFQSEDLFVDESSSKALIRWVCTIEGNGRTRAWHGLDVLHFDGSLVCEKHTYAKAATPLLSGSEKKGDAP